MAEVGREYGINETTVGNWVRAYREKHGETEEPLTLSERARLAELERKNRELEMKCAFLTKAAAYSAAEHRWRPERRTSLRLPATLLLAGQLLYIVVTQFHADGDANNYPAVFAEYARSGICKAPPRRRRSRHAAGGERRGPGHRL